MAKPSRSSIQYMGSRNPTDAVDFYRRANERGVIDLTGLASSSSVTTGGYRNRPKVHTKKRSIAASSNQFSTPGGKRRKTTPITSNLSNYCEYLEEKWDQGKFRWVHKGMYAPDPMIPGHDGGPQNGELCVLKEFKTGSVYERSFFKNDIKAVDKAGEIIDAFNVAFNPYFSRCYDTGIKEVLLNRPCVWEDTKADSTGKKKKKLVEPMLEGTFLKFNSNSGYVNGADFMQALSHFSYHHTGGKYLLCDLQGGHYERCYVLTDPVIMSWANKKKYGATDLGSEGIENFFAHHQCSRYCRGNWMKPRRTIVSDSIPVSESTSMSLDIGTGKFNAEHKRTLDAILSRRYW
jgi:hypothetical protein